MDKKIEKYTIDELNRIRGQFLDELREASQGISNSIAFERHAISGISHYDNPSIQVIVMGGSNLIISLVEKINQKIRIDSSVKEKLPSITSKNVLLELVRYRLIPGIKVVVLNFAYPMEPYYRNGKLDGKLIRATKEHSFGDLIGNCVGEEIEKYIHDASGIKLDVIVANDTICLIMSGLKDYSTDEIVGGIVGTGFNFGFFLDKETVVNLESGNFNKFTLTESGKHINKSSENPGAQLLEKEVSGAYLYKHYNFYADLFNLKTKEIKSTHQLSDLASGEGGDAEIAHQIIDRSASLVATQIAAIKDFKERDNLTILIEGSLFWKGTHYSSMVHRYLEDLGIPSGSIKISRVPNSNIIGASYLAFRGD